jgi:hypothetical protein
MPQNDQWCLSPTSLLLNELQCGGCNFISGFQCLHESFSWHLVYEMDTVLPYRSPRWKDLWTLSRLVEIRMSFLRTWSVCVYLEGRCESHQALHEIQAFWEVSRLHVLIVDTRCWCRPKQKEGQDIGTLFAGLASGWSCCQEFWETSSERK